MVPDEYPLVQNPGSNENVYTKLHIP